MQEAMVILYPKPAMGTKSQVTEKENKSETGTKEIGGLKATMHSCTKDPDKPVREAFHT